MIPSEQLRKLYAEHGRAVYTALARHGVEASALDDAFHDTWVVAWKKGPPKGDFGPWIHGIAHKVASRYRRSAKRTAAVIVHEDVERAAVSPDPERAAYAREVARAVGELDLKEREALVAAAEGYTAAEIAAESPRKLTEDGAESRVARARKAIRSRMNDDDDDKMVVLPPFDGERLWQRIERTISVLEDFDDEPVEAEPPSTAPVSVPLAPAAPLLAPGVLPIAKAKLGGLLLGAFVLGTSVGAGAMHTWCAHRHGPGGVAQTEPPPATAREERTGPDVTRTSPDPRSAGLSPPVQPPLPHSATPGSTPRSPGGTTEPRSFYPRLRRGLPRSSPSP